MSTPHPTVVVATQDSLLEQADGLALLAFGAFSDAGPVQSMAGPRHLAFLTPDALDLDLDDPLQRHFANYELKAKIGQGGMGVVYRARQAGLEREVALKLLAAGPWASVDFIERFKREAQSAARMQHPNIVPIFEIGSQDGLHFFSMRLVRGPSLAQVLAERGAMAPKPAAVLVRTLAEALDYAHRLGVLHLDLKPGNVLIDEHGEPQVADFGLSRRLDQTVQSDGDEVSGTPSYMAPEQATARAHRLSQATDIYGLGTILYELLTGRPPFLAATAQETLQRVVSDPPKTPRSLDRRIPADLEAICLKCLAKEPAERYRTARELSEELARFVDGRAVLVRPLNAAQRIARWAKREPRVASAAALAITALIVGLLGTTTQWRRAEQGTAKVQDMLWTQRLESASRFIDQHDAGAALPLLVANLAEKERAGATDEAALDRARIGAMLATTPRLIAAHKIDARIVAVGLSPDAAEIAIGSAVPGGEKTAPPFVHMIDRASGVTRWSRSLEGLSHFMGDGLLPPESLHFTPDGSRLLVHRALVPVFPHPHGMDMVMLDARTGESIVPPPEAFADFRDASFSPDGKHALLRDTQGNWQAFEVEGWKALAPSRHVGDQIVTYAPGGKFFASGTAEQKTLRLYSAPALELLWEPALDAGVSAWRFDDAGTRLAIGLTSGQVLLIDCVARSLRALGSTPDTQIVALRFVANDGALVAASQDGSVTQWSLPAGTLRHRTLRAGESLSGLASDRAGELLALIPPSARSLGTPAVLQLFRGSAVGGPDALPQSLGRITTGELAHCRPMAMDSATGLIAVGTHAGTLSVWRAPRAVHRKPSASPLVPTSLEFDGRRLVGVQGREVWLFDAGNGKALWPAVTLPEPVGFAALAADTDILLASSGRVLHRIRAADGSKAGAPVALPNSPQHLSVAPGGRHAVVSWHEYRSGHLKEVMQSLDLDSGQLSAEQAMPGPLLGRTIDREARRLLVWRGGSVSVLDLVSLRSLRAPIVLAQVPSKTPASAGARAKGEPEDVQLFDVIAANDTLIANRFRKFGAQAREGSLCRASISDGSVSGCTETRSAWTHIAGNRRMDVVASSIGQLLHADGTLEDYGGNSVTWPSAIAVSADGARIARIVPAGVEVIDLASGQRVAPLLHAQLGPGDLIAQLAFSPDGQRLAGRSLVGRWLVWELPPETRPLADIEAEAALLQRTEVSAALPAGSVAMLARNDPGAPHQEAVAPPTAARWIEGFPVSPRSPDAPTAALDLTSVYNVPLPAQHMYLSYAGDTLVLRPDGVHRLLGVDYDIRGAISLGSKDTDPPVPLPISLSLPEPHVSALQLLVGAPTLRRDRKELPYLNAMLHYRDGTSATHSFLFLRDLPSDWIDKKERPGNHPRGRVGPPWTAWLSYPSHHYDYLAGPRTLSALRLDNPHPEREVETVELAAEPVQWANPWIFAITVVSHPDTGAPR